MVAPRQQITIVVAVLDAALRYISEFEPQESSKASASLVGTVLNHTFRLPLKYRGVSVG
jgi:hypothetical protein